MAPRVEFVRALDLDVTTNLLGTAELRAAVGAIVNRHASPARAISDDDDPRILTLPPLVADVKFARDYLLPKGSAARRERSGHARCTLTALGTIGVQFGHQSSRRITSYSTALARPYSYYAAMALLD